MTCLNTDFLCHTSLKSGILTGTCLKTGFHAKRFSVSDMLEDRFSDSHMPEDRLSVSHMPEARLYDCHTYLKTGLPNRCHTLLEDRTSEQVPHNAGRQDFQKSVTQCRKTGFLTVSQMPQDGFFWVTYVLRQAFL